VQQEKKDTTNTYSYLLQGHVSLDPTATPLKCIGPPPKCTWSRSDLDLWPLTLKTFSTMPTHVLNICAKCLTPKTAKHGEDVYDHDWAARPHPLLKI